MWQKVGGMMVLCNLKIEPLGEGSIYAKVLLNGQNVRCRGYNISHYVDEIPTVALDLACIPTYEHDVVVQVANKEEIARLMDKNEFIEFCKIWNDIHSEEV